MYILYVNVDVSGLNWFFVFFIIRFCDRYVTLCQKPFSWEDQHFSPTHLDFRRSCEIAEELLWLRGYQKADCSPAIQWLAFDVFDSTGEADGPWMMWMMGCTREWTPVKCTVLYHHLFCVSTHLSTSPCPKQDMISSDLQEPLQMSTIVI